MVATTTGKKINGDAGEMRELHGRLYHWFETERKRQRANRFQMALDEDYYDSIQWRPDEAAELMARGQQPTVYNEIKPTVDWLIGVERRTRVDFAVMARSDEEGAEEDARCKTKLLKYIADVNRVEFERSAAADDCFKAGLGWLEVGISPDPEDEPIYTRAESWRNILYDSLGPRRDLDDSRYLFRYRIIDLDIALAYFPDKERELRAAAVRQDREQFLDYFNGKSLDDEVEVPTTKYTAYDYSAWDNCERERVVLIEAWHKQPTRQTTGLGASAIDRTRMLMRCTIMTEQAIIMDVPSPYAHNRYPFIPYWCYRRKKDNAPYSVIRAVRSPQDALNKRMSKAIHVMSTNQVIAEASAFDDEVMTASEARDELQSPDAFVLLARDGLGRLKTNRENDVAQGHLQLAQSDRDMIRNLSGMAANTAVDAALASGVAIQRRSEQGSQQTAEIFDNMLFARQLEGELKLSLIEQFYSEPKTFSIAGERHKREYVRINQPDPVTGQMLNDVTARQALFVIGENSWQQTLQQAAFESMMTLLTQLAPAAPQVVTALLDTVFELADLPNKRVLIQRIRQLTGMSDPDDTPTPEQQQAAAQAQAQQQAQQQALLQAQQELQLAQARAEVAKATAQGAQLDADRLKKTIEAVYVAMQAGQTVSQVPAVTPIADALLKSVGFHDQAAVLAEPGMDASGNGGQVTAQASPPVAARQGAALQQLQTGLPPVAAGEPDAVGVPDAAGPATGAQGAARGIETMTGADNLQGVSNEPEQQ